MIPDSVRQVAIRIGLFYLDKNKGDYEAAGRAVDQLRISKIETTESSDSPKLSCVTIHTARPGLMIGRRASNLDALAKFLECEVKIVEDLDCLYDYLTPRHPSDLY